eukprot:10729452-Alexandrium_andersonii.AAC.1
MPGAVRCGAWRELWAGSPRLAALDLEPVEFLASHAPRAKDCTDCGLADCGLEPASWPVRGLGPPSRPTFVGRSGICAKKGAERTLGSFGDQFEAAPGPAEFQ